MKYFFLAAIIVLVLKTLDLIYFFQIKEYRFDRFFSGIKEQGTGAVLYNPVIHLPAKKLRNFLIFLPILIFLVVFAYFFRPSILTTLIILMLSPIIGFLLTAFFVSLTGIPVYFYRKKIINDAKKKIAGSKAVFIGITGSYGKTSAKEMLYDILKNKYKVAKTDANMNSDIGIALSVIKNLKDDTQYFIAELGAYKRGEIKKAAEIVRPTIAVITAIGNQHLSLFGSKKNLVLAKKELLLSLPKNGRIYLNKDIDSLPDLTSNLNYPICYFSINSKADIYVKDTKTLSDGITVKIVYKDKALPVKIDLLSIRQVSNLLPAVAIAYDLGMTTEEIGGQLLQIKPTDNRLSLKKGINGSLIIDDSYNSNIEGFKTAIETARQYTQPVKIIVTKGIIELGQEKSESYEQIVDKIYKAGVKLYTTDRLFKKMDKNNQVLLFKKEKDLGDYLCSMLDQHTLLIIEGKFTQQFIKSIIKL